MGGYHILTLFANFLYLDPFAVPRTFLEYRLRETSDFRDLNSQDSVFNQEIAKWQTTQSA